MAFIFRLDTSGFDFNDEPSNVRFTPRRTPGNAKPKGSAKKKTTDFANILASMKKQSEMALKEKNRSRRKK